MKKYYIRNKYKIDAKPISGIEYKVAESKDEFEQSFRLVQAAYVAKNLTFDDKQLRISKHNALPTTAIFIAKKGNIVIATMSVVTKIKFPLPLEELFDIAHLEKLGQICEVTAFATDSNYRKLNGQLILPLMVFMFNYSYKKLGNRLMVICTHPKASQFYSSLFYFSYISKEIKNYKSIQNAPAAAMYCNMDNVFSFKPKFYEFYKINLLKSLARQNFSKFTTTQSYQYSMGQIFNNNLFRYFFKEKSIVYAELTANDKKIIDDIYHVTSLEHFFKRNGLFYLSIPIKLLTRDSSLSFTSQSLSLNEIRCPFYTNIEKELINSNGYIEVSLKRECVFHLEYKLRIEDKLLVLQIDPNNDWTDFINYLTNEVNKEVHESDSLTQLNQIA